MCFAVSIVRRIGLEKIAYQEVELYAAAKAFTISTPSGVNSESAPQKA
jgi:hypothetical protein